MDSQVVHFERWENLAGRLEDEALTRRALNVLENAEQKNLLEVIFRHSSYLTQCFLENIELACDVLDGGYDKIFEDICGSVQTKAKAADLMRELRQAKKQVSCVVAVAEITEAWPIEKVTQSLSRFADLAVQAAVEHVFGDDATGVSVVALGKWGGEELNYSSDIDFIVVYDPARIEMEDEAEIPQDCVRKTRELVRILEERTEDGYVFRTDLRLRPDAMPMAFSIAAAEVYYGSLGQNWERAAMIKARPVAGDEDVSQDFMVLMSAWIWRKNLDFATIQDIHSIKRQINANSDLPEGMFGYNVKLGHGGIREIEFFAQTQQLIYGGRTPELRSKRTLETLESLQKLGKVSEDALHELHNAYVFLRKVEHRLQMVQDQQIHELPAKEEKFSAIAMFLGYDTADSMRDDLLRHVEAVKSHYAALFEEAPSLAGPGNLVFTGMDDDPATIETLTEMGFQEASRAAGMIRGWHHGRYRATRSLRARQILTELVPALLEALAKTTHPDDAFLHFDKFLEGMPSGVPLFSMFQQNPELMDLVAEIMGSAPRLAAHLGQHPDVLDSVLTQDVFAVLPERNALEQELKNILSTARHYEQVLNILRRWTRDKRFQAGLHILKEITEAEKCSPFLSDVAEIALQALMPYVEEDFARTHGKFSGGGLRLIAMGRLGSQEMGIGSDLDLVAVYKPPAKDKESDGDKPLAPGPYYQRLTQRLITALTALTEEGVLYEVDMRLRPHGDKGPLAVSVEAFQKYQENEAWTWEHMSLCRARVVYGPEKELSSAVQSVLTREHDPEKLVQDALEMRAKLADEFGTAENDMRHCRGGLVDIDFIVQVLQLKHGKILHGTRNALAYFAETNVLPKEDIDTLENMFVLATRVQARQRLCGEGDIPAELNAAARAVSKIFDQVL